MISIDDRADRVPVPTRLTDLPRAARLVVPEITLTHRDRSRPVWGAHDARRAEAIWREHLCQICADPLTDPVVVFVRPLDYLHGYAAEPGCHPECAYYSKRGCPMLNGTQHHHAADTAARYTRCADPDCACRFWIPQTGSARQGRPADAWYEMWLRRGAYLIVADPQPEPDQTPEPRVLVRGVPYLKLRKVRDAGDTGRPDPLEMLIALRAATGD